MEECPNSGTDSRGSEFINQNEVKEYDDADDSHIGEEYVEIDDVDFDEEDDIEEEEEFQATTAHKRKSFVWKYFRAIDGGKTNECIICNSCVGNQTSNLARHLAVAHEITKPREQGIEDIGRSRPSRSIIWKYCTKEDVKHARCHLCQKLLYFGGGNTGNITKHLRRKHPHLFKKEEVEMDETSQAIAAIEQCEPVNGIKAADAVVDNNNYQELQVQVRKERKGGSYVWNYCDKLSRHTIRCKLCNKVMSFHGTANVITHLQRKHNVLGKVDSTENMGGQKIDEANVSVDENCTIEQLDEIGGEDDKSLLYQRRRSNATMSVVWKYCTRVGKDAVRCGFCKKNLSYQGTSNLQRHLHRMHGIVTQGRTYKHANEDGDCAGDLQYKEIDNNFIWEHCTMDDEQRVKCNMCSAVYSANDVEEINKHLTVTHAIVPRRESGMNMSNARRTLKRRKRRRNNYDDESSDNYDDFENDSWTKHDDLDIAQEFDDANIKKDDSFYDDIIEEERDDNNVEEDPFDPSMVTDVPVANPLSAQSSRGVSPELDNRLYVTSKRMHKLNEERVRMETEYFREKAGFYRMQKYLTALQAKKVRLELERFNNELNGVYTTVDVGTIQQHNLQAD